ncbi:MAG: rRNA maturation RNase YbeY [Deltaproteobacteria bacterium]|nr:rRNA maturation RNase YbeY [Deltaproteobacteria bacterium]
MAVLVKNQQKKIKIDVQKIRKYLSRILEKINCKDKELSLLFVNDEEITEMNRQYLNRDYPTNVIAFPMMEGEFGDINPHVLGDIVVSVDTALRDAQSEGFDFDDEVAYLLIHGVLHLIGFDHERSESEAAIMKEKERELFLELKGYLID